MRLLDESWQVADGTCNREVGRSFLHAFWFRVDKTISDLRISWVNLENLLEDRLCCRLSCIAGCSATPCIRCHHSSCSVSNGLEKMKSFLSSDRAETKEEGMVASSLNDILSLIHI